MKLLITLQLALWTCLASATVLKVPKDNTPKINNSPIQQSTAFNHEYHIEDDDDLTKYPNITLDHGVHIPTLANEDAGFVLYKNIGYGQTPTGDLRFAPPKPIEKAEGDLPIFDGSKGQSCYQAVPQWVINAQLVLDSKFDWEKEFKTEADGDDCLFLDVATPLEVVENEFYPVVVFIFGGGYVYGKKDMNYYTPAGFYRRATKDNKFLFVSINYRMGAFGFLSGPAFVAEGGTPNLGLHDQRLALKWVQENISKFGGDPKQVTVIGESAGGGSIVHQLVFNEETKSETLFQKAIVQSPGWIPVPGSPEGFAYQDDIYESFLRILDVENLAEAKEVEVERLVAANRKLVGLSPYGTFTTGPVVDGDAIQANPISILNSEDHQPPAVEIMTGGVAGEGLPFVPLKTVPPPAKPWEWWGWKDTSNDELKQFIKEALPLIDYPTIEGILQSYPHDDPKYSYLTGEYVGVSRQTQRLADIVGQALIQCNARAISTSYGSNTYNYLFSRVDNTSPNNILYLPLLHGGDIPYTFYDLPPTGPSAPSFNIDIAEQWQLYLLGFILESDPNHLHPKVNMSRYGPENRVMRFDYRDVASEIEDVFAGPRCDLMWPAIWGAYGEGEGEGGYEMVDVKGDSKEVKWESGNVGLEKEESGLQKTFKFTSGEEELK